jgi:hypothetical protein
MIQTYGMVTALGYSNTHCGFTRKQLTHGPVPETINAIGDDDYEVHLIYKLDNGNITTAPILPPLKTLLMAVTQWVFDQSKDGLITVNKPDTNAALAIAFNTNDNTITCGDIRVDSNNRLMPEWISIDSFGDNVKVWLYPPAMDEQYEHRQYIVASPITNVNLFVTANLTTLKSLLVPYLDRPFDGLNSILETSPSTHITEYTTLWKNKDNPAETYDIPFTVAVYGPGEVDAVEVRSALKEFLLANSTHDALTWEKVFPELFSISTYTLIPTFDTAIAGSIPTYYNPTITASVYRAMFESTDLAFEQVAVLASMDMMPTVYQSMTCAVMPIAGNSPEAASLRNFYGDYILASNLSPDFIRMRAVTRTFVNKLIPALMVADGTLMQLPAGISEEIVNGIRFISFTVADCHIRILPKTGFVTLMNKIIAG